MALDQGVLDSVTNANFKGFAEIPLANALSHQNRVNVISETALGRIIDGLNTTSVPEGLGISAAQRGDLSKTIADLSAAVASIQQMMKGAQTTIPVTG